MDKNIVIQKIRNSSVDNYTLAEKYYNILSAVNGLGLTNREIQLVAFTAIHGNMSYTNIREDFCKKYDTSFPTINNIISKLKKIGVLVKERGKIKVNPVIVINFNLDVTLEIKLIHDNKGTID